MLALRKSISKPTADILFKPSRNKTDGAKPKSWGSYDLVNLLVMPFLRARDRCTIITMPNKSNDPCLEKPAFLHDLKEVLSKPSPP